MKCSLGISNFLEEISSLSHSIVFLYFFDHIDPDIMGCKVKWALRSIIRNKASGCDEIPVELFQILKDDAVKVLNSSYSLK